MRTLVALSGGVDSAVAAARLKAAGHDLVAVHLRTGVQASGQGAGGGRSCCGMDDARDAREVASALGLPFYVVDVADAFQLVIGDFKAAYTSGRTPNPCILCNRYVKFGRLREIAHSLGAQHIATGHYARVREGASGRMELLAGEDSTKDQSYVLCTLTQDQLRAAVFPLGESVKTDVRAEALGYGLPVADKPDSQELCFVPEQGPRQWLKEHAPEHFGAGTFVNERNEVVGHHDGAVGFTVGQRRGLPALGSPHYVSDIDIASGRVRIAAREALLERDVLAGSVNWVSLPPPAQGSRLSAQVRIRHAAAPMPAELQVLEGDQVRVRFDEGVFAVARGQAAVAYDGPRVLMGATILKGGP